MPDIAHPFDDDLLESLLEGRLSLAAAAELELHLEICADCQNRLDRLAAEPEEWQEVRERLSESDLSEGSLSHPGAERERRTGAAMSITEYLAPTDDPHMMGRLGAYEIAGIVGAGGMGVVLKGFDRALNRFVAIKVLGPHLATSATARKRFSREAQAAAAVVHDNIVAIHGVSEANGLPYLVMPYIRGQSLQRRLDQCGSMALVEVLRIGYQIAAGLAAAHSQGLVHRDIKPANILLEEGVERLRITDFGLARAVDDATLTQEGTLAGTPEYMSPEQARAEIVGPASDLFSLGSLLYAACTGRPPFRGETSYGVLRRITDSAPPSLRELNPDIPDWLDAIVLKLLSKEQSQRFASAEEVAKLFQDCLGHVQHPTVFPLPMAATALVLQPDRAQTSRTPARVLATSAVCLFCFAVYWMVAGNPSLNRDDDAPRIDSGPPTPRVANTLVPLTDEPALSFSPTPSTVPVEIGYVRGLAISADGRWIAAGWGNQKEVSKSTSGAVAIWEVANRQLMAVYPRQTGVYSLSFSANGGRLAFGSGQGTVTVLDRETGAIALHETIGAGDTAVRFSPQGTWLAAGSQSGTITFWHAGSLEKHTVRLEGDPAPVLTVCFSADETMFAAGGGYFPPDAMSGAARVWEVASGNRLATLPHVAAVMDVAFRDDGSQLATASLDARARLWNLRTSEVDLWLRDPASGLVSVKFLPGNVGIATLGPSSGIKLWARAAEQPRETIFNKESHWTVMAPSPDGTLIASGGHDRRVHLWNASTGASVAELKLGVEREPTLSPIVALAVCNDGQRMATAHEDGGLLVRQIRTNQVLRDFDALRAGNTPDASSHGSVKAMTFTQTGNEIISGGRDGDVRVWDISSGGVSRLIRAHDAGIASLALSPDGTRLATGSTDRETAIWEFPSGREVRRWSAHESAVPVLAFFPTGGRLLTAGADGRAKVWRLESGDLLASCDSHTGAILAAAISPDGQTVATGGEDGRLLLWSSRTGLNRRSLPRQTESIRQLQFSGSGSAVVSGGEDGILQVWDPATLTLRQSLTAHSHGITGLSFAGAHSNDLITTGADGTAKRWRAARD